jgi:hypothetical protein
MRYRALMAVVCLCCSSAPAIGQDVSTAAIIPAERILRLRGELELDSVQIGKLRDLEKLQAAAVSKVAAVYLRAEADLLDAMRSDDLVIRRLALEKRSKAAIDAELIRLKADKDARALLSAKQNGALGLLVSVPTGALHDNRRASLWESLVTPVGFVSLIAEPDSAEIRIAADPLGAEIYLADRLVGYGRVAARLPVGAHTVKFRTPSCTESVVVTVVKGPPAMVTHKMACSR